MLNETKSDIVIIGTSPLALIEGLWLSRLGRRLHFIDSGAIIGGSWRSISCFGFDNVEVGVHFIENRIRVNRWLKKALGEELLDDATNHDFGLLASRRIPISSTRILLHGLVASKAALRGRFGSARLAATSAQRALRNVYTKPVYPAGGMSLLLSRLHKELCMHGARFQFDQTVERLATTSEGVSLVGPNLNIAARNVVMFSRANAPIVGVPISRDDFTENTFDSIVLLMRGSSPLFHGYVEVIADKLIKRARNISGFAKPNPPPDAALLCVQVRSSDLPPEELVKIVVERLCVLRLIDKKAIVEEFFFDRVSIKTLNVGFAKKINAVLAPKISIYPSTDFSECLADRLRARDSIVAVPCSN